MRDIEFNNCVDEHADGVYRFIVKNIGHVEDAQDIVQTAFEKLWVNRNKVAPLKAKSYLFTVAYHQMIDPIRKEKKATITDSYEEANAKATYQKDPELKQLLLAAINE